MKYLEGSRFSVHVGGSSYAEGWDRIFGMRDAVSAPYPEKRDGADQLFHFVLEKAASASPGCFGCERVHAVEMRCFCLCHQADAAPGSEGGTP